VDEVVCGEADVKCYGERGSPIVLSSRKHIQAHKR
jgi:hypothetical protein